MLGMLGNLGLILRQFSVPVASGPHNTSSNHSLPLLLHTASQLRVERSAKKRQSRASPSPPSSPPAGNSPSQLDDEDAGPSFAREAVAIHSAAKPLFSLVEQIKRGEVNLQPEYQRDFVWDSKKCMGLIKTVYESLPVPAVMMFKRQVEGVGTTFEVVDGKQRLVTLYAFLTGDNSEFPKAPTQISLDPKEDEMAPVLHGKRFEDLSNEDQRCMRNYDLQVQVIPEGTSLRMVYRIYENINAGGMDHSDQQLRRAAFHGSYIKLLNQLAALPAFQELAQLTDEEKTAQQGEELVLRFFALRRAAIPSNKRPFRTPMKTFLNDELQTYGPPAGAAGSAGAGGGTGGGGPGAGGGARRKVVWEPSAEEMAQMKQVFETTLELATTLKLREAAEQVLKEGGGPRGRGFRRTPGGGTGAVWDVTLVGLSLALDSWPRIPVYQRNAGALRGRYQALLRGERWGAISATLSQKSWAARLEAFRQEVVEPALAGESKAPFASQQQLLQPPPAQGPRGFSKAQKQTLYDKMMEADGVGGGVSSGDSGGDSGCLCAWCGKPIVDISHAEVDHVVPYSLGGPTDIANGQLLHALCNRERGRRPMEAGPAAAAAAARRRRRGAG